MARIFKIGIILIIAFSMVACGSNQTNLDITPTTPNEQNQNESDDIGENQLDQDNNEPEEEESNEEITKEDQLMSESDLKTMKVNELGKIMVLMYHEIGNKEDIWVRTPENFRKDLQTLYDKGYRAISLKDYLLGNINTPPGTTPVVFTFDDGTKGQFNLLEDNDSFTVDPNCAVGILEEFYDKHPDFGLQATFFVFYPIPFRQQKWINEKYQYLIEKGMEIGNHSHTHENLRIDMKTKEPRDASFIQETLGRNIKMTQEIVPGYEVDSLALPYGAKPKGDLYDYVVQGSFEDVEYHHKGVLLVGSNPARPPYHEKADMANIPRIRASEMETENTGLYDWLKYFDDHPEERYISDGNPNTISFPKDLGDFLDITKAQEKIIQAYE